MAEEKKKLSVYEYIRTHLDGDGRLEKGCRIHVLFDRAHRELPDQDEITPQVLYPLRKQLLNR